MIEKYFAGKLPEPKIEDGLDKELRNLAIDNAGKTEEALDKMLFSQALSHIWQIVGRANKYIDETMPWVLAKNEEDKERLGTVLYQLVEAIRVVSVLIQPFMTTVPKKIWEQLGLSASHVEWDQAKQWNISLPGINVVKKEVIFPRLDIQIELSAIDESTKEAREKAESNLKEKSKTEKNNLHEEEPSETVDEASEISIDEFFKVEMRVAEVLSVEKIAKADKLLKLQLDLGYERRQVVSGIAKYYQPEELIGKKVICVTNLKPVKLKGELSRGMVLAASTEDSLVLATVSGEIPNGTKIS